MPFRASCCSKILSTTLIATRISRGLLQSAEGSWGLGNVVPLHPTMPPLGSYSRIVSRLPAAERSSMVWVMVVPNPVQASKRDMTDLPPDCVARVFSSWSQCGRSRWARSPKPTAPMIARLARETQMDFHENFIRIACVNPFTELASSGTFNVRIDVPRINLRKQKWHTSGGTKADCGCAAARMLARIACARRRRGDALAGRKPCYGNPNANNTLPCRPTRPPDPEATYTMPSTTTGPAASMLPPWAFTPLTVSKSWLVS
jgi:hypothetical protein